MFNKQDEAMFKKSVNFDGEDTGKLMRIAKDHQLSFGFMVRRAVSVYLCYRAVWEASDTSDPKSDINVIQRIFTKHGLKSYDH